MNLSSVVMKQSLMLSLLLFFVGLSQSGYSHFELNRQASQCKTWPIADQDGKIHTLEDGSFYINCEFTQEDQECQLRHYYDGGENIYTSNNENSVSLSWDAMTMIYLCDAEFSHFSIFAKSIFRLFAKTAKLRKSIHKPQI